MELVESDGKTSIDMLLAVKFLSQAQEEVTGTTIQHSFRHAGLCQSSSIDKEETGADFEDDLPLTEWVQQFNMQQSSIENLQAYIEVDNGLAITGSLTDEEILNSVRKTQEQQPEDEEDETTEPEPPPSIH